MADAKLTPATRLSKAPSLVLSRCFWPIGLACLLTGAPLGGCDQQADARRGAAGTPPADAPSGTPSSSTPPAKPAPEPSAKPADKPAKEPGEKVGFESIDLGGKRFSLELALTPARRFHGLSDRTEIPSTEGMLFVFPDGQVAVQNFVMRDCPIPIDILYLDAGGRVLAMHEMKPEPPRARDEKENTLPFPGAPDWSRTNEQYENRLKKYTSRFPSQFVIELAGGTLKALPTPLKVGDKVLAPWRELAGKAR